MVFAATSDQVLEGSAMTATFGAFTLADGVTVQPPAEVTYVIRCKNGAPLFGPITVTTVGDCGSTGSVAANLAENQACINGNSTAAVALGVPLGSWTVLIPGWAARRCGSHAPADTTEEHFITHQWPLPGSNFPGRSGPAKFMLLLDPAATLLPFPTRTPTP